MNNPKQVVGPPDERTLRYLCSSPNFANDQVDGRDSRIDQQRDEYLRGIAAEYHDRCDMFDNGIAPGGKPRRPKERRAMILHSMAVREELEKRVPSFERLTLRYFITEREHHANS